MYVVKTKNIPLTFTTSSATLRISTTHFCETTLQKKVSTLAIDPTGSLNGTGTKDKVVNIVLIPYTLLENDRQCKVLFMMYSQA